MDRVNKLSRGLVLFTLLSGILSSWPAVKAVQGQSLTPTPVVGSSVAHRYVIFLPTICPTSPAVAPSAFGCPAFLTRINAAQRGQSAGMFGPLLQAMRRARIAFTPYFYSYPDSGNYRRPSLSNKADWYLAQDTNGYLMDAARRLDRQVREILQQPRSPNYQPHATIDLIGHGLGGLVAAFWVATIATPAELSHVHGLIAFDTPLQGFSGALAHEERLYWTGKIGADLLQHTPGHAVVSINNARLGLLRKLPRVLTIAGTGDQVVGAQIAWLGAPGSPWNLQAAGCARGDTVCHLAILSNHGALACAAGWLSEGTPRDAMPFALTCPLTHHAARSLPLIVPRTTKVLPAAVTHQIVVPRGTTLNVAASSLPLTFHTTNATVRQLQPGDVITSGPTPAAPYGLLRKVTAVQSTGSQTVVQTTPATLEDAVSQMDVTVHGTVGAGGLSAFHPAIPGVTAQAIPASQVALSRPPGAAAPLGRDPLTVKACEELHVPASKLNQNLSDAIKLVVQFCVGGTFNFTVNMPLGQPIQTAFTADLQDSAKIELKGDLNLSLGSTGDPGIVLGYVPLVPLLLVPPAIYAVPELQIVAHADGSISASVDVGASASIDIIAGVNCINTQCTASESTPPPSLRAIADTPFTNPSNLNGSLKVSIGPHLVLTIDGIPGPELDLDFSGEGDLAPLANPWWKLWGEATLSVQYHLNLFKVLSINYDDHLLDQRFDLLKANGSLFPPTATATALPPTNTPNPTNTALPIPPTSTPIPPTNPPAPAPLVMTVSVNPTTMTVGQTNQLCITVSEEASVVLTYTYNGPPTPMATETVEPGAPCFTTMPLKVPGTVVITAVGTPTGGGGSVSSQATVTVVSPAPVVPGGLWVSPAIGSTTTGQVQFEAEAYPTNPGDPAIAYVNFTMGWPTNNPTWTTACTANSPIGQAPDGHALYGCTVDLSALTPGPPPGPILISFDVYDQQYVQGQPGHSNLAPNGEHTITYQPAPPPGPTEQLTVNPTSGAAGSTVCLTWTDDNDSPGGSGTISFDGQQLASYQAGSTTENWSGCLAIPTNAQSGPHTFSLAEGSDNSGASATFTVTGVAGPVAASSGPNYPTSTTQDGSGSFSIGNITGVQQVGGAIASGALNSFGVTRFDILTNTGFGFTLPSNAVITGIVAEINRHGSQNIATRFVTDSIVQLVKGASAVGSNKADTVTSWDTSAYHTITYGSPTDLWGTTWSPSDINSPSFGLDFTAQGEDQSGSTTSADIDFIRLTVYYTVG